MKLLITGAAGFLGRCILSHFVQAGWTASALVRKLDGTIPTPGVLWHAIELPSPNLSKLIALEKPDLVVHAAASANVRQSVLLPHQDFLQSVATWSSVLDAVRSSGLTPKVVLLSSAAVYGNPKSLPIHETDAVMPISPYGWHKAMCETMADYYRDLYGLSILSLRIFSAYGVGLRRQVIWDMLQSVRVNGEILLAGTGDETRDYIHSTDVARALACVVDARIETLPHVINVGSGIATTIESVAHIVRSALEAVGTKSVPIRFDQMIRKGDPRFWQADVATIRGLGFSPSLSLEMGINQYVRWVFAGN